MASRVEVPVRVSTTRPSPNTVLHAAVEGTDWTRRVLVILTLLLMGRIHCLAILPLDLCPDEAYYWDWSRQLDYGYFSKPPMIAWLIATATFVSGSSEFVIRLPAALLGTLGLWAVYKFGQSWFGARSGCWAMLAAAATPGLAALSLLMTIDAPFLCCWAFAAWCVGELLRGETVRPRWWLPAVVATGCGLLSKQTMLAIFPCAMLWLMTDTTGRRQLRSPWFWSWVMASLLFLAPVVWWNWQHNWVTLLHTQEHFQSRSVPWTQHVGWFVEFWASQIGMISPVTWLLCTLAMWSTVFAWQRQSREVRWLLCLSFVPLLAVTVLSAMQRVQPNWPAAFYLPAILLAAAWATGELSLSVGLNRHWFSGGIACGGVLTCLVYAALLIVPNSSWSGTAWDVTARLRGWRELASRVDAERQQVLGREPHHVIALTGRGPVSELAYYLPDQPRVYRFNATGIVESQHEVWGGPESSRITTAMLIVPAGTKIPQEFIDSFAGIEPMKTITTDLGSGRTSSHQLSLGKGFRGWPRAPLQSAPGDVEYREILPVASRPRPFQENVR